jgi:hypothetical protein
MDIEVGRIDGYSIQLNGTACAFSTPSINTDATIIIGFAVKFTTIPSTTQRILSLFDGATEGISLRLNNGGELSILLASSQLEITSGLGLVTGSWYWIELKVLVDNAAGTYEVKVGSSIVLSDDTIDTQVGANAYYDIVRFKGGDTSETDMYIDDFYIANGAGSINNDFLGNVHVTAIFPDGAGTTTGFTPSTGSNYACVDENPSTDDTDYVESDTTTTKDTYSYGDISALSGIKGIQINTLCRETDATNFNLITVIRSDSTDYDSSGDTIGTTNYTTKRLISEEDPATTNPWLYADINAAEFGIKVG